MSTISDKTKITFGVAVIIIAGAISWGVMYEKVQGIDEVKQDVARIDKKIDTFLLQRVTINP